MKKMETMNVNDEGEKGGETEKERRRRGCGGKVRLERRKS
jgi:hypothetical protein